VADQQDPLGILEAAQIGNQFGRVGTGKQEWAGDDDIFPARFVSSNFGALYRSGQWAGYGQARLGAILFN
jgi:hypothetical protein